MEKKALITNDAVVLGILMLILAFVFYTAGSKGSFWSKFYKIIPSILLCYFIPSLLNTLNVISGDTSSLYPIASRYFLPASLVLLTIGIDIPALRKLGGKALIMFFAGTLGVMIGGPLALFAIGSFYPDALSYNGEPTWHGFSTIAGSWIGGGANQTAMKETFKTTDNLFAQMVAVDVLVANVWMGLLLYGTQHREKINRWLRADNSAILDLEKKMETIELTSEVKKRGTREWMVLCGIAFGVTGLCHFAADHIAPFFATIPKAKEFSLDSKFFWIIVLATTCGLLLSFTRARKLEGTGASDVGTVFLYFLVATIGMGMDLGAVLDNPIYFVIGGIWIIIHIIVLLIVAKIIRAPYFFVAVGSQANIGGAASAPIVAAAFNKYLAPVGVLLAVLGYAVGTYGAYAAAQAMRVIHGILQ